LGQVKYGAETIGRWWNGSKFDILYIENMSLAAWISGAAHPQNHRGRGGK
jgi:hypothetical protein